MGIVSMMGIASCVLLVLGVILLTIGIATDSYTLPAISAWGFVFGFFSLFMYSVIGTETNVKHLKVNSVNHFSENGLEIVVCEGYKRSFAFGTNYGGGKVFYQVYYKGKPEAIYSCYIQRWGEDNIQLMYFRPINKYIVIDGNIPATVKSINLTAE